AWRGRVSALETIAPFRRVAFNVSTPQSAEQVEGFEVSAAFFPLLGVEPARGRGFTDDDARPGRDAVVLLSHGFWQRRFAAHPAVVGREIEVDGRPSVVIGVLPARFRLFRVLNRPVDLYRPLVLDAADGEQSINVYARLAPRASLEQARAQLATAYAALPREGSPCTPDLATLSASFAERSRPVLLTLQGAVALVLLIACANVANLLL